MDNKSQIVRKVMDHLYVDPTEGLLKDYRVVEDPYRIYDVIIHVLINTDSYWNGGPSGYGGWYNLRDMEERIKSIMKYVGINKVEIKVYMDDSMESMTDWNNIKA